jgi:hypothetical protein
MCAQCERRREQLLTIVRIRQRLLEGLFADIIQAEDQEDLAELADTVEQLASPDDVRM